jgi:hypothetical protein
MPIYEWLKRLWRDWTGAARDATANAAEAGDKDEVDTFNPFPEPVEIEITDVIDLHTIPPRDVKRVIEEYLHQAQLAGFCTVRIIHGKGIGVQREIVRTVLRSTPFVADWTDGRRTLADWAQRLWHSRQLATQHHDPLTASHPLANKTSGSSTSNSLSQISLVQSLADLRGCS